MLQDLLVSVSWCTHREMFGQWRHLRAGLNYHTNSWETIFPREQLMNFHMIICHQYTILFICLLLLLYIYHI